ncbi:unnamed protein product [Chilo suppressalis]|uniref:DUF4780 domain-containing protein n=1 Tax=Chilo suppressalis TaxID=168631 RepID=A0ABN8AYT1_CHISP|nr:unnamed protein product [Chilo suppressalis]
MERYNKSFYSLGEDFRPDPTEEEGDSPITSESEFDAHGLVSGSTTETLPRKRRRNLTGAHRKHFRHLREQGMEPTDAFKICYERMMRSQEPEDNRNTAKRVRSNNESYQQHVKSEIDESSTAGTVHTRHYDPYAEMLPSTSTGGTNRRFKEPPNDIRVQIRNIEPMTNDQLRLVKRAILRSVIEAPDNEVFPKLEGCIFKPGWLLIILEDEYSRDWLWRKLRNIKPWPEAELSLVCENEQPKTRVGILEIPRSEADSTKDALRLLEKQNLLRTYMWEVLNVKTERDVITATLSVDDESIETLRMLDFRPRLGFMRVLIHIRGETIPTDADEERPHYSGHNENHDEHEIINLTENDIINLDDEQTDDIELIETPNNGYKYRFDEIHKEDPEFGDFIEKCLDDDDEVPINTAVTNSNIVTVPEKENASGNVNTNNKETDITTEEQYIEIDLSTSICDSEHLTNKVVQNNHNNLEDVSSSTEVVPQIDLVDSETVANNCQEDEISVSTISSSTTHLQDNIDGSDNLFVRRPNVQDIYYETEIAMIERTIATYKKKVDAYSVQEVTEDNDKSPYLQCELYSSVQQRVAAFNETTGDNVVEMEQYTNSINQENDGTNLVGLNYNDTSNIADDNQIKIVDVHSCKGIVNEKSLVTDVTNNSSGTIDASSIINEPALQNKSDNPIENSPKLPTGTNDNSRSTTDTVNNSDGHSEILSLFGCGSTSKIQVLSIETCDDGDTFNDIRNNTENPSNKDNNKEIDTSQRQQNTPEDNSLNNQCVKISNNIKAELNYDSRNSENIIENTDASHKENDKQQEGREILTETHSSHTEIESQNNDNSLTSEGSLECVKNKITENNNYYEANKNVTSVNNTAVLDGQETDIANTQKSQCHSNKDEKCGSSTVDDTDKNLDTNIKITENMVIVKSEQTISELDQLGDDFTVTILGVIDPFLVIEISSDSDSEDDDLR